ncbi:hypothetical protein JCM5350_001040 [Sporobolomyces pararoseus]
MSRLYPQQQFTPPLQAMELEDKEVISLPSCKELFKVVDFGKGVEDSEFKFDIRTFAGSTGVLPPSPLSTPPLNILGNPFDRAYENVARMVEPSIQPAHRPVSQSKSSVVPYISLAEEEEKSYIRNYTSLRDTGFSQRRNRLPSPFHLQPPISTFKSVLPPRKSLYNPHSFYNKTRASESAVPSSSLPRDCKYSPTPPCLPLHSTPTPPSPPLSVAHLSPPSHLYFDTVRAEPAPRRRNRSQSVRNNDAHFKPNRCPICPKSFVRFNDLKRHLCIHSGER